jgi:hypothetical protein
VIEARRPTPRPARRLRRALATVVVAVVVFGLGIALGQALDTGGEDSGTITRVRTLKPLPLPPARETVTVTANP